MTNTAQPINEAALEAAAKEIHKVSCLRDDEFSAYELVRDHYYGLAKPAITKYLEALGERK